MESSDNNSCDDTDGWVTIKNKRPRKALIDSPGHGTTKQTTTKHVNGITKVIKVESRSPTKHQKVEE